MQSKASMCISLCAVAVLVATSVASAEPQCKGRPEITGACYWEYGWIRVGASNVHFIEGDVTDRSSILDDGPDVFEEYWAKDRYDLVGDFEVCPLPKWRGALPQVCIEAAKIHAAVAPMDTKRLCSLVKCDGTE